MIKIRPIPNGFVPNLCWVLNLKMIALYFLEGVILGDIIFLCCCWGICLQINWFRLLRLLVLIFILLLWHTPVYALHSKLRKYLNPTWSLVWKKLMKKIIRWSTINMGSWWLYYDSSTSACCLRNSLANHCLVTR